MKKMKTFWMDSNLSTLLQNLFPSQNQGEFIRKSVESSMERALKRIWNPIGYVTRVSNHFDGVYCFKYFYGFYPKLKRQFVFIQEIDGALFVNALPGSREALFQELNITPDETIDILFLSHKKTISISQDNNNGVWDVLVRCTEGTRNIDVEYKAFVEEYVRTVKINVACYGELRYYGVREALGFPVDYDFDNYKENYLKKLTGHLEIINLPDEYKKPTTAITANNNDLNKLNSAILDINCVLENELFKCSSSYFGNWHEPALFFKFEFKKNDIVIYPGYKNWLSFCDGITNTIVSNDGKLKSINFDSIYNIIDNDLCIFRGMKFDMNITSDNLKLQDFINQYINLSEYKKLISDYELAHELWKEKNGEIK